MNFSTDQACVCCGINSKGMSCLHHLLTRGAWPELQLKPFNLIPVCQEHHNEFHSKGITYMADKYGDVNRWLLDNGWYVLELKKRWWHDGANISTSTQ